MLLLLGEIEKNKFKYCATAVLYDASNKLYDLQDTAVAIFNKKRHIKNLIRKNIKIKILSAYQNEWVPEKRVGIFSF